MFCTKCGSKFEEDARFCGNCGNSISQEEQQEKPVQAVQPELGKQEETVKPRKSMKKPGVVAIALILILAIGFFFKDAVAYGILPEKYLLSSMNNTFKSISKDLNDRQSLFIGHMSKGSGTNNLKLMVKNIRTTDPWASEDLNMFNGAGLELTTAMDKKGKALYLSGKTIYNERDLISLNAKLDDNELLVNIPELYHKSFTMPSKNFGQQWNISDLASETYMYVNDSLDLSYSELMKDTVLKEMDAKTKKAYVDAFNSIISNANVEKVGSEKLVIGGKDKKCNRTRVTLNTYVVNAGLIELIEAFQNDNRLEQFKENLISVNQEYTAYGIEQSLENLKSMIDEDLDIDRIGFDIYTHNGKAVQISLNLIPDMDYKEDSLKINLSFLGEKSLMDDFEFECIGGEFEEFKVILTSKANKTGNKKGYSKDTKLVLSGYGDEFARLNLFSDIDLSKSQDNLRYDFNIRSEDFNASLKVKGDFKTSSKNIEYNLHDVVATMEDYYGDSFVYEGSILLGWEDTIKNISSINDTQKIEILGLLEFDLYDIMEAIDMNMTEIMYSFGLY